MSLSDGQADRGSVWDHAFRVQRDVAVRVPINYVTVPAVSLRAACFADNIYEDTSFRKCLENLLDFEFQRFVVDVFWDASRATWSLCPVSLGPEAASPAIRAARVLTEVGELDFPTQLPWTGAISLWPRQEPSSSASVFAPDPSARTTVQDSLSTNSDQPISTPIRTASPIQTELPSNDTRLARLRVGQYDCTPSMTLSLLADILQEYLDESDNTFEAFVAYLTLNVHAAAPSASPDSPAPQPDRSALPSGDNFISDILKGNLSSLLYTPHILREERSDLNDSWFDVSSDNLPEAGYYEISERQEEDTYRTSNGWPTEAFLEFKRFYRVLASFGSIDPQMTEYNISNDLETVFSSGSIESLRDTSFERDGSIRSGCISADRPDSSSNSSWAFSVAPNVELGDSPSTANPIPSIANMTACGISPLLNRTVSNATADTNPTPYMAVAYSTLWSWAPNEPQNHTGAGHRGRDQCAVMQTTSYPGRWRPADCSAHYQVACQDAQNPFGWSLSARRVAYGNGDQVCPSNTKFSVPHTALENSHLLSAIQNDRTHRANEPVFLNLNALDVPNCWVVGIGGSCPYNDTTDADDARLVVVPTVAAVIVFVLAALTLFVKCAANRQENKRGTRRRNVGSWEYEGVPS